MNEPKHPHLRRHGTARQLVVRGQPMLVLGGELHNSSASSLEYMAPIWERMRALNLNTVLAPLYWELTEPREGAFDFTLIDGLVAAARTNGLHLVFLWFATWKNATSCYAPAWVKADWARFTRMQCKPGRNANTICPLCTAACEADARAFAAVMAHIRGIDADEQTVVMMQVENETGLLGAARDHSPAAEAAFASDVPADLMRHLDEHHDELNEEFARIWRAGGSRVTGTWTDVFGEDADEVFMAWHVARYVDQVAAAGRAEYDIPMYANAWLRQKGKEHAGLYPSGGPVARVHDVWRAAASHIDLLAPDIYAPYYKEVCARYARGGNALFVPEARWDERAATAALYTVAAHDALGFSPFAIDSAALPHPLSESNRLLAEMAGLILESQGRGRIAGFQQEHDDERWQIELAGCRLHAQPRGPLREGEVPGGGLVIALDDAEFIVAGRNFWVEFSTPDADQSDIEFLWLDEGTFENGQWVSRRRLNGDETAHNRCARLGPELRVYRLKLNTGAIPVHHQAGWVF